MKDRNGRDIQVGDAVRFLPTMSNEEWYCGQILSIEENVNDGRMSVASIVPEDKAVQYREPVWRRRSSEVEKVITDTVETSDVDDPDYPVRDWQYQVANGDTRLGYAEWVRNEREANHVG